jgi:hypothetical protein
VQSRALADFCAGIVNRHALAWPPTEERLAQEFLAHFGSAHFRTYEGMINWCENAGISFLTTAMPHDLRGLNCSHENGQLIVMPISGGSVISREHTFLHELREVIERVFENLKYPLADANAIESRADQFAVNTRIALLLESSNDFFALAGQVRDPLGRFCANGLAALAIAAGVLACASIHQLEARTDLNG